MEERGWRPRDGSKKGFAVIQAGDDGNLTQGSCSRNREKEVDLRDIKEADVTRPGN